jgi:hypothetical protein
LVVPWERLVVEEATTVDMERTPAYEPSVRTRGTGLPGYHAGWFRTRGGEKVFAVITDRSRVAHVPTREGYRLLLSVEEPERFLERLRALSPSRRPDGE